MESTSTLYYYNTGVYHLFFNSLLNFENVESSKIEQRQTLSYLFCAHHLNFSKSKIDVGAKLKKKFKPAKNDW